MNWGRRRYAGVWKTIVHRAMSVNRISQTPVCICFVALKVYKELERLLKSSDINMSVDKVLALAQTVVTIQLTLPHNKQTISRTMLMKRHQRIAKLFTEEFWGTH